jgi:ribulose kinase
LPNLGNDTRSLCTVVCKWTFQEHKRPQSDRADDTYGWDETYFTEIGLEEFVQEKFHRIGTRVGTMGQSIGHGLTERAAKEFGLVPGTAVSIGIIDAHAGGIGLLGTALDGQTVDLHALERRLAIIAGKSSHRK